MVVKENYEEHRDKLLKEVDKLRNEYGSENKLNNTIRLYAVIFIVVSLAIYFWYLIPSIHNKNEIVVSIITISWIVIMAIIIDVRLVKRYGDIYWINKLYDSICSSVIDNHIIEVIEGY